ncbi:MAG: hypothetical protein A2Y76_13805 [Planctomycetes bacterium RBG_13_60_9]|nr:MAG: hypothetical protein A2Y76_13805 [Planctomycetes bacterium RBG_13_60_9]
MNGVLSRHVGPLILLMALLPGCSSVHSVDRADEQELAAEGTVVFVRPTEYSLLGTKSLSDYVEVVYEQARRNDAGLLEVRIGLRAKGGQHFWDVRGRDFPVSVQAAFYDAPIVGEGQRRAPIYETNWQRVSLLRGATSDHRVVCPVKSGAYYQVTLSELK